MSDSSRSSLLKLKFAFPTPPPKAQKPLLPSLSQSQLPRQEATLVSHVPHHTDPEPRGIKVRRPLIAVKMDRFTCYNCRQIYPRISLHPYSTTINRMICNTCVASQKLLLLANIEPFTRNFSKEYLQCQQEKAQGLYG